MTVRSVHEIIVIDVDVEVPHDAFVYVCPFMLRAIEMIQ